MADIVRLIPDSADAERNRKLFDWARTVLMKIGIVDELQQAQSLDDLRAVTLDVNDTEIALAIRDALHPASGKRQECFRGLAAASLKKILLNQFRDLKKDREKALRHGRQAEWSDDLILNERDGTIIPNLANLILIFRKAPAWKGVLAYDEFNARVVIKKRPPWGKVKPDASWTDHHESLVRVWFQKEAKINPGMGDVGRAVQAAALHNKFHPVHEYFEGLKWDGVSRLDEWLIKYFHAEDTPYIRAIAPRYLISAVARVYQPGCQVDHTLVLEGPQGKRKSEALRTLAIRDEWFTDRLSHLASKDAGLELAGVLIIEIAEMDALARASSSTAKSFLTRRHDRFRPPYGKHTMSLLRQNVFAATINPPSLGYLRDPTGARRFWPVKCGGMIDRDGLERDRDQLWAEAIERYKAGHRWHLETPELEALATAEQAARYAVDAWEPEIREWLGDTRNEVTLDEVCKALEQPNSPTNKNRVQKILTTRLGFRLWRPRTEPNAKRPKRYRRDAVTTVTTGKKGSSK